MKRLGVLLVLVVLSLLAVLYGALFTESGTHLLLHMVERALPLQIDYRRGSVGGELQLARLRYETNDLRVDLDDVVAELERDCLLRGVICFRQLKVGRLDIDVLPGAEDDESLPTVDTQAVNSEPVVIPVLLETAALDVDALRVRWSGGEWRQQHLRGEVRLHDSRIDVISARIEEPRLVLQETDSRASEDTGPTLLPPIDLPLILSIVHLQLVAPAWDVYGAVYQQDEITVRGQWDRSTVRLDNVTIASREQGNLLLHGELTFAENWPLEAAATIQLAEPEQYFDRLDSTVQVAVQGDLSALQLQFNAGITAPADAATTATNAPDAIDVVAEGQVNVLDPAFPFTATVMATSATSTGALSLADIEGIPGQLQDVAIIFPLTLSTSGSLHSQHFELSGTASGLGYESLRMVVAGDHIGHEAGDDAGQQDETGAGKIVISELSLQDVAGVNSLHGEGEILLSPLYRWSLRFQTSGLDVPAINESLSGRVDGSVALEGEADAQHWKLRVTDVTLQGEINGLPASIRGFAGIDSDLHLSDSALQAQLNGAQLSLQSPGDAVGPGHFQLHVEDIGRWLEGSSGRVDVDVDVSPDRERIRLSGRLQRVSWDALQFESATLSGDYQQGSFTLDTAIKDVALSDMRFAELHLTARGDARQQTITLASRGDIVGELAISGKIDGEHWQGALAPTRLQTPLGDWQLFKPVAMSGSLDQQQLKLAGHCWQNEHAQLCPGAWTLGKKGSGSVKLDSDLRLASELMPADVELAGAAQVQLEAQWAPGTAARIRGSAHTEAVTIAQHLDAAHSATFGWDAADISLEYTQAGLRLAASVVRDTRNIMRMNVLLSQNRNAAIYGSLNVDALQLAALAPFVPALSTLAGELSADLSLSGTIDKPLGSGSVTLAGGALAVEGNPTQLEKLDVSVDVQGTTAEIRGTGVLGGGELKLAGRIDSDTDLRLELQLTGDEHTILYPPSTEFRVSEVLQIVLQKNLLELKGDVTVLDGVLQIEQLPEGSVAISPSVVEVDTDGNAIREELPFDVRMNVQIHIADRFVVTGDMLRTTLGGDLRVQQRPGKPLQLFGNLDTIGGEFRAYETRLQIKRGTINFIGPATNPNLDVRAERHISSGDVTVGVRVQGPLEDDLQLQIYSDPSMSQADAMSYLIRGRAMDAGAGLDGTSAALSLASGVVNRSELVTELNRIPGLSKVEFGAQGSESDTAATVSGYLGERLYLSYGVGLYEPVNVLTARFYLRSRLWLEVISSIENSLDLYYSFDID